MNRGLGHFCVHRGLGTLMTVVLHVGVSSSRSKTSSNVTCSKLPQISDLWRMCLNCEVNSWLRLVSSMWKTRLPMTEYTAFRSAQGRIKHFERWIALEMLFLLLASHLNMINLCVRLWYDEIRKMFLPYFSSVLINWGLRRCPSKLWPNN